MALTPQEKSMAYQYALNGAKFMFIPTTSLRNKVANRDIQVEKMYKGCALALLSMRPVRLNVDMVIKYCTNKLDKKNTWILDQGDIKVTPSQFETKIKENDNGKRKTDIYRAKEK